MNEMPRIAYCSQPPNVPEAILALRPEKGWPWRLDTLCRADIPPLKLGGIASKGRIGTTQAALAWPLARLLDLLPGALSIVSTVCGSAPVSHAGNKVNDGQWGPFIAWGPHILAVIMPLTLAGENAKRLRELSVIPASELERTTA